MNGHAAVLHDPEASLRAELTTKIAAAQADIESKLSDLRQTLASASGSLAITQAESQLRGLSLLQRRIDRADPASLSAIRAEVAASVSATQSFIQQVQGNGAAGTAERVALQQASEAARGSVSGFMHAYYDEHRFDRYLQFASAQDEEEYRKREQERRAEIDKALAEHTPEGNLRATQLSIDQLKDAGAHGADKSPDYAPLLHSLETKGQNLAAGLPAANSSTLAQQRTAAALEPSASGNSPPDSELASALARFRQQVSLANQHEYGPGSAVSAATRRQNDSSLPSH